MKDWGLYVGVLIVTVVFLGGWQVFADWLFPTQTEQIFNLGTILFIWGFISIGIGMPTGVVLEKIKVKELAGERVVMGCDFLEIEVLSEVYYCKTRARQVQKCISCEEVRTVKVMRPTIREIKQKQLREKVKE